MPDCHICGKAYRRTEHRNRHLEVTHGKNARTFPCTYSGCDKVFQRNDVRTRHEALHKSGKPIRKSTVPRARSSASAAEPSAVGSDVSPPAKRPMMDHDLEDLQRQRDRPLLPRPSQDHGPVYDQRPISAGDDPNQQASLSSLAHHAAQQHQQHQQPDHHQQQDHQQPDHHQQQHHHQPPFAHQRLPSHAHAHQPPWSSPSPSTLSPHSAILASDTRPPQTLHYGQPHHRGYEASSPPLPAAFPDAHFLFSNLPPPQQESSDLGLHDAGIDWSGLDWMFDAMPTSTSDSGTNPLLISPASQPATAASVGQHGHSQAAASLGAAALDLGMGPPEPRTAVTAAWNLPLQGAAPQQPAQQPANNDSSPCVAAPPTTYHARSTFVPSAQYRPQDGQEAQEHPGHASMPPASSVEGLAPTARPGSAAEASANHPHRGVGQDLDHADEAGEPTSVAGSARLLPPKSKPRSQKVMSIHNLVDGTSEWPHDYNPASSRPTTVELTQYRLSLDSRERSASTASSGVPLSLAPPPPPPPAQRVLIRMVDEDAPYPAPSPAADPSAQPASSGGPFFARQHPGVDPLGDQDDPPTAARPDDDDPCYRVTDAAREQLLAFIRRSCTHAWSRFRLAGRTEGFLTTQELGKLVRLFFRHYSPEVPFIHQASFRPEAVPSALLLMVVTVGLVYFPRTLRTYAEADRLRLTSNAAHLSVALAELARIGVVSAVESDQRGFLQVFVSQSWLLQQTFGLGGGDKRLHQLAERNRGGIITFARRLGLLRVRHDVGGTDSPQPAANAAAGSRAASRKGTPLTSLEQKWQAWIDIETRLRLGWAIYLYDQQYTSLLDVPPLLIYSEISSSLPCDERLWTAKSAQEWQNLLNPPTRPSSSSSPSPLAVIASSPPFIPVLRSLLGTATSAPVSLNRFGAIVIATTLYRLMWDGSKQSVLFDDGGPLDDAAQVLRARSMEGPAPALSSPMGNKCAEVLDLLCRAVLPAPVLAPAASSKTATHPLLLNLELVKALADLHFSGPPGFIEELKNAAGRMGMASHIQRSASASLSSFFGSPRNETAARRMLATAAKLYACVTAGAHGRTLAWVTGLFEAALVSWAYVRFTPTAASDRRQCAICANQVVHLGSADPADQDRVERWVRGISSDCPRCSAEQADSTHCCSVVFDGLGLVGRGTGWHPGPAPPSRVSTQLVLMRFAEAMRKLDWGLARNFCAVLARLAESRVDETAGAPSC
ncbi:uncharacterized protein PFL1_02193 [Pseudozyma flocculosa PF-1]|uniref:C2H2-type domain-containing protein n=1 Tax=Pseudozyma flocculosa TaxID=84751 RepID=A0A5C3FB04_9BASI|nr:uncharacterized protein PFL1_02193 [Pseudozyma flocculosa PF-1]EPQ30076.1 hypothetical protein PFL1_02193 [Pseudozyma flocculosa PF-1]SPO41420.1 uncharacterized protein PSFLO_06902 [Pseudozyma flocculosa]